MHHDLEQLFGIAPVLDDEEDGAFIDPITGQIRLGDLAFLPELGRRVPSRLPLEDAHAD